MMGRVSQYYSYLLILSAVGMTAWGLAGFIEYLFGVVVLIPLQNPNFPSGTQFIHWLLITLSGTVFLFGYWCCQFSCAHFLSERSRELVRQ